MAQQNRLRHFAAFSIIRFRTTVTQSRDIGFLFLAMAAGLASGAGLRAGGGHHHRICAII